MNSTILLFGLMRGLRILGAALLIAGLLATLVGVLTGDIQVGLALFFIPYLQSSSWLGALAILLIFVGIVLLVLDTFYAIAGQGKSVEGSGDAGHTDRTKSEFGGVVLLGPIPIVFGSNSRMALMALLLAAAFVTVVMLVLILI